MIWLQVIWNIINIIIIYINIFASLADQRGLFETSLTESWKETIDTKMLVENN